MLALLSLLPRASTTFLFALAALLRFYEFAEKPAHPCENGATAHPVMRGRQERTGSLFSYVGTPEKSRSIAPRLVSSMRSR
ncbi:hypothetical protein [Synechococcus sp. CBW1004]|uniref:hypothetical protein n=1 Tax=Synechococcus sp. CBW1004 TaxID=1353136 RepID=UPI0018CD72FE|nr:hypothetical protein [Synechococcus sp. CBW1004]QPN64351.1 hypothetical protein H8F25_06250 [Synechococcus sp. CBW1004]